jgi:hypothetical protein
MKIIITEYEVRCAVIEWLRKRASVAKSPDIDATEEDLKPLSEHDHHREADDFTGYEIDLGEPQE